MLTAPVDDVHVLRALVSTAEARLGITDEAEERPLRAALHVLARAAVEGDVAVACVGLAEGEGGGVAEEGGRLGAP
eukprot:CAMPEP_0202849976 /NCGR_PEP_ID=MMETSP1389-20130828/82363_1 /ASSEMBLY_ACC=CAM_ASM_000865 /TAXON_ID=302021 /ORGANISM="Rhodomonas sp., Strain CCMP768" /LENGTH=75 /DNA_ID=CAMNT_0049528107 /DNA_START=24 /DNA_END=248 /DNA_ORIENTATION=+